LGRPPDRVEPLTGGEENCAWVGKETKVNVVFTRDGALTGWWASPGPPEPWHRQAARRLGIPFPF
jgi:hypothetical protein